MPSAPKGRPLPLLRRLAAPLVLCATLVLLASCAGQGGGTVPREQLFALGYGPAEDQLDLFQVKGGDSSLKTRIAMRGGVFYLANGNAAKVQRLSSYGDVLALIYNPDRNPEPSIQKGGEGQKTDRIAVPYPFRAPGEIAVDSKNRIFVEDRMPPERRIVDATGASLDYAILRFGKDCSFEDYLGQEGIGGTPFPYILGLYVTAQDDLVVVSLKQDVWLVHWFDTKGSLRNSLRIPRDSLPKPAGNADLRASLDRIVPDSTGVALILKVDYSREMVDTQTKSHSGIEYAGSWIYRMDLSSGGILDRWELPPVQESVKGEEGAGKRVTLVPELLGVAGERFFLLSIDDESHSSLSIFNRGTKSIDRYPIEISPDELYFSTLDLSPEGVLSALLGTKYEARLVWWRFDRLTGLGTSLRK